MIKLLKLFVITCLCFTVPAFAMVTVTLHATQATAQPKMLGTVTFKDTSYGLLIKPNLQGLPQGMHGLHLHLNPSCHNQGKAAGGHFDPSKTNKHVGPYVDQGHLGDLPALHVDANGNATLPILAPRISERDLIGHALMVHSGHDNYSDVPKKLGGGGARVACGVITAMQQTKNPKKSTGPKMPIQ